MARSTAALERLLESMAGLADVPGALATLGVEPDWEPVPPALAFADCIGVDAIAEAAIVGRSGALPWYGAAASNASAWAARLARHLARRGEVAAVALLDASGRRLCLSVAFGDAPVLDLDLGHPDRTLLRQATRLRELGGLSRLALAARMADVFGAEEVGRRFFRRFAATYDLFVRHLTDVAPVPAARELALLQLTRVLFLYFVQARGWLDGRDDFLAREVDRSLARRGSLQRHLLAPLCFGTLNRPRPDRSAAAATFGDIPFLNGGLFEPHPLERRYRVRLTNALWREAFDEVFERFRFTAAESESGDAIAPDMLGRVFEGLMERGGRKAKGTYYTPAALVRRMLEETFAAWIAGHRGCSRWEASRMLENADPAVTILLRDVTVLDPAVGSGAFLLGALEFLAHRLSPARASTGPRRAILERHLFGVDKDATAVRLAELRLWLAVLADDGDRRPEAVRPLPNLDCLVRQGDSLFDPWWRIGGMPASPATTGPALAALRRRVILAPGGAKSDAVRDLRRTEVVVAREMLERVEAYLEREVRAILAHARDPDLFGKPRGLDRDGRRRLSEARTRRQEVRGQRRALDRQRQLPWFHYQCHFGDVFARRGGFDLVVGNPPWVRAEELPPADRARLRQRYRWWRGSGPSTAQGYRHQPDLALAFLERAVELAAPGGVFGLLVPRKVTAARYATAAREALGRATSLEVVADLTGNPLATFEATTYPLALIGRKSPPEPGHVVGLSLDGNAEGRTPQATLAGGAPWILNESCLRKALAATDRFPRLSETFRCHLGVKTGANEIFLDQSAEVEDTLRRWVIRGRDARAWRARLRLRLIWTHDARGRPLAKLPPLARGYFSGFERRLAARADYRDGPPWQVFRTAPLARRHLVVWPDVAARLTALPLCEPSRRRPIPLNSCYLVPTGREATALALAAWLNSTPIRSIARARADVASGGYARFNAAVVGHLPLPPHALEDESLVSLARQALGGNEVQSLLDSHVSRWLELDPAACLALGDAS